MSARIARADGNGAWTTALGRCVEEARDRRDLSQTALATIAGHGITQNWVSKVESGEYQTVDDEKLEALAAALDMPVEELIRAQSTRERIRVTQLAREYAVAINPIPEMAELFTALSKPNQKALVRMARVLLYGEKELRGEKAD